MLPWKTMIEIDSRSHVSIYLQIANCIIKGIKSGVIKPNLKMPSSRELCSLLKVHRKTVVNAYSELDAQGWITSKPYSGTFVSENLPVTTPVKFSSIHYRLLNVDQTEYKIKVNDQLHTPSGTFREMIGFHDGPDVRLVPTTELSRAYRRVLNRKAGFLNLSYVDVEGKQLLKKVLSEDMNVSRGMNTTPNNVFITRGSQMAIYMLSEVLLQKDDLVIVGEVDYYYACKSFTHAGAKLVKIKIDDQGIDVDQIESICKKRKIRAVYVTAHHHFPTTVTLSAARRMKLLSLSEQYGFIILEDDYDYDFHYQSNPILPVASADRRGMVVYIGTLSKTIAPAFRIGYIAAPVNLIKELAKLRQIIDVQGDPLLEQAIAELFVEGEIRRHMKKALKEYKQRRNHMCALLNDKLGEAIDFKMPDGGLAIWAKYDKKINLPELSAKLREKGIVLSSGLVHDALAEKKLNSNRMGFGWMNIKETEKAIDILYKTIHKL
ncbi:MAG: PLP-dependent aminotransferase family protein [Saprospiraceae bacterium]|nr:PLP-dependent aminotransferase family protein [Saprospiraceae bacterium]